VTKTTILSLLTGVPHTYGVRGRPFALIAGAVAVVVAVSGSAAASASDLDPSYGNSGTTQLSTQHVQAQVGPFYLDGQGRTLLVWALNGTSYLARLDSSGHLDQSYGSSGRVLLPSEIGFVTRLVPRPGGVLLLGSQPTAGDAAATVLLAVTAGGAVDTAYGNNGLTGAAPTAAHDQPQDVAVTSDGSAIVAMNGYQPTGFRLIRFDSTGDRDLSFGGTGVLATSWPGDAVIWGLRARGGGRFLAVGSLAPNGGPSSYLAVAAYNGDGSTDTTFGRQGRGLYDFDGHAANGRTATLLPGGDLLFAVDESAPAHVRVFLLRTDANGKARPGFGVSGRTEVGSAVSGGGLDRLVVHGSTVLLSRGYGGGPVYTIWDRVSLDTGAPDQSFGNNGEFTLQDQVFSPYGIDSAGRIYDSGVIDKPFSPVWVVQRRIG
jgi:hypothetical protein